MAEVAYATSTDLLAALSQDVINELSVDGTTPVTTPGAPILLTTHGTNPTITGTVDGVNQAFVTSIEAGSVWICAVDNAIDTEATWVGTALTTYLVPTGVVTLLVVTGAQTVPAQNDILTAVLNDASRDMDAYLGSRYTIPVTNADALAILRPKCVDIAKFKLMERRFASKYDPACSEAKNNVLTWLGRVAKKDANLYGATEIGQPTVYPDSVTGTVGSDVQVFTDPNDPSTGIGLL